jgi:hypothetical protein
MMKNTLHLARMRRLRALQSNAKRKKHPALAPVETLLPKIESYSFLQYTYAHTSPAAHTSMVA